MPKNPRTCKGDDVHPSVTDYNREAFDAILSVIGKAATHEMRMKIAEILAELVEKVTLCSTSGENENLRSLIDAGKIERYKRVK